MFAWQTVLTNAMEPLFSFPCWLSVDSRTHFVGCVTNKLADRFANSILRVGAMAFGPNVPTAYRRSFKLGPDGKPTLDPMTGDPVYVLEMGFGLIGPDTQTGVIDPNSPWYIDPAKYLEDRRFKQHEGKH
jgi:hypothetical protein